jgi:hypothetical protein
MIHIKQRCISCGTGILPGNNPHICPVCGAEEWEHFCTNRKKTYTTVACPWCAYLFLDAEFVESASLAKAFRSNWEDAMSSVATTPPSNWLRSALGLGKQADLIDALSRDSALEPDEKLTGIMLILDPEHPLWWRDQELNAALLRDRPDLAARIVESSLPELCKSSVRHDWLSKLQESWLHFRDEVSVMEPKIGNLPSRTSLVSLQMGNTTAETAADALPLLAVTLAFNARKLSQSSQSRFIAKPPVTLPPIKETRDFSGGGNSKSGLHRNNRVAYEPAKSRTAPRIKSKNDPPPATSEIVAKKYEPTARIKPELPRPDLDHEDTAPPPTPSITSRLLRSPKWAWAAAKSVTARLIGKIKHMD